ncbi:hypothetical protein EVAR_87991_1 [Eumeta japonica]|uniref:Secreted protein n=1 Tax=Eumeta variegata TaxID=151549 RepID=A0A4C1VDP3_EUMVA|nr:hypothetical protein EVAR_87991_1 [Eumeta japonica]
MHWLLLTLIYAPLPSARAPPAGAKIESRDRRNAVTFGIARLAQRGALEKGISVGLSLACPSNDPCLGRHARPADVSLFLPRFLAKSNEFGATNGSK